MMSTIRQVKCIECDNMILPQTAADNAGLCGQCVKLSPELRAARREYERRLAEGSVFEPSDQERASAATPGALVTTRWQLQPEYYADRGLESPVQAILEARTQSRGFVFLVTDDGQKLNLGFTERYGVCEYQDQEAADFRYAYCPSNLREQVRSELHVEQACPCCGDGLLWYPSRYHMPRTHAFAIVEYAVAHQACPGVEWLEVEDFSYTRQGRG